MPALPVFTPEESERVQKLLAAKVADMMGRKMEEGDWASVYCAAKQIPLRGWSNLDIDIIHGNLGVEHKMLRFASDTDIVEACGARRMHPAATRSIRIPSLDADPNEVMADVLSQYAALIEERRQVVAAQNQTGKAEDMRTGWLLWQDSLRQFLYFEEPMTVPSPALLVAEWRESKSGRRKGSKNLWIYERATQTKRYSVTTSAGIKIQPYFDVPLPDDPNLYVWTVMGERLDAGNVRVWLTTRTAAELEARLGSLAPDELAAAIEQAITNFAGVREPEPAPDDAAVVDVRVPEEVYLSLLDAMGGVNDDHSFRLVLEYL